MVDDDADARGVVSNQLHALGYKVVQFIDGEDILVVAQAVRPSLVVTDVFMPRGDGIEVLGAIKKLHPSCPVIAVASTQEPLTEAFLGILGQLGADATLIKPFGLSVLRETIRKTGTVEQLPGFQ